MNSLWWILKCSSISAIGNFRRFFRSKMGRKKKSCLWHKDHSRTHSTPGRSSSSTKTIGKSYFSEGCNNHRIYYAKNNILHANGFSHKKQRCCFASRNAVLWNKIKNKPPQVSTATLETAVHREDISGFLSPLFHVIDQLTLNTRER